MKNRQKKYLNNLVEQNYRLMKRFVEQGMGIFSFDTASRALQEYEAMTRNSQDLTWHFEKPEKFQRYISYLSAVPITMPRPKDHPGSRPRWVGSPAGSDFPAALLRFGACLGIEIEPVLLIIPNKKGVHFVRKVFTLCERCSLVVLE
ncbi:MAG TPA: hypothetical protein VHV10_15815 [Ktedonobacteraceae bacterium]|nr:hypothetical protein [Ktedonobacteraceae bacterium]